MGITVVLEDERGTALSTVEDQANLLHRLLPNPKDVSFHTLRFIDWYGDTVINRLQLETFIQEWDRIAQDAQTEEEQSLLCRIRDLATKGNSSSTPTSSFTGTERVVSWLVGAVRYPMRGAAGCPGSRFWEPGSSVLRSSCNYSNAICLIRFSIFQLLFSLFPASAGGAPSDRLVERKDRLKGKSAPLNAKGAAHGLAAIHERPDKRLT